MTRTRRMLGYWPYRLRFQLAGFLLVTPFTESARLVCRQTVVRRDKTSMSADALTPDHENGRE